MGAKHFVCQTFFLGFQFSILGALEKAFLPQPPPEYAEIYDFSEIPLVSGVFRYQKHVSVQTVILGFRFSIRGALKEKSFRDPNIFSKQWKLKKTMTTTMSKTSRPHRINKERNRSALPCSSALCLQPPLHFMLCILLHAFLSLSLSLSIYIYIYLLLGSFALVART